jgi:hypothetical protein
VRAAAATAACLITAGCETQRGFEGVWRVRAIEVDRAYWVDSAGDSDRTLVLEEARGRLSGHFADVPESRLTGAVEGGRASLTNRSGDVLVSLGLTLDESRLAGDLRKSVREDYGGWWRWQLSGQREADRGPEVRPSVP